MNAKELIKAGKLGDARALLVDEVKKAPGEAASRTLLAQVLMFQGEWDKAERHLEILAMRDTRAEIGVQVYRNLIAAERERLEVYAGKRRPAFLGPMPPWLDEYLLAWEKIAAGEFEKTGELLGALEEQLVEVSGTFNGAPFDGLGDQDDFLAPFLELFVHEQYLWLPFSSLRELTIVAPATLMDTLWTPAGITTWEGLTTTCYLPVTYSLPAGEGDDLTRLGKITDWRELGGGFYRGRGQHLLRIGEEEKGILEIRELNLSLINPEGAEHGN